VGKSSGAPQSPNYEKIIPIQEASNRRMWEQMITGSRTNTYGPQGSSVWSSTSEFDQAGYDRAMEEWKKGNKPATSGSYISDGTGGRWIDTGDGSGYWDGGRAGERVYYNTPGESSGVEPSRDSFMRTIWSQTNTLNPQEQANYEASARNEGSQQDAIARALAQVQQMQGQSFNPQAVDRVTSLGPGPDLKNPTGQNIRTQYGNRQGEIANILGELQGMNPQAWNNEARDAAYSQATRYMEPQNQQETAALEGRLAAQGFVPGTPAYSQAMSDLQKTQDMATADARDRAILMGAQVGSQQFGDRLSALNLGASSSLNRAQFGANQDQAQFERDLQGAGLARQNVMDQNTIAQQLFENRQTSANFQNTQRAQQIAEALQMRQLPINELNALRGSSTAGVPNLNGANGGQGAVPALQGGDYAGAATQNYQGAMQRYNSGVASDNASMAAIVGVLSAMLGASDRRVKTKIQRIGTTSGGHPWYRFAYIWAPDEPRYGVMAQDLGAGHPAVHIDQDGYFMVDYSKVA